MPSLKFKKSPSSESAKAFRKVKALDARDTQDFRDVHGSQQMNATRLEKIETPTKWRWIAFSLGVIIFVLMWLLTTGFQVAAAHFSSSGFGYQGPEYTAREIVGLTSECYYPTDPEGNIVDQSICYGSASEVPMPEWAVAEQVAHEAKLAAIDTSFTHHLFSVTQWKLMLTLFPTLGVVGIVYPVFKRRMKANNLDKDSSDINQHFGDSRIALPGELMEELAHFPDIGAHASEQPATLISHSMLTNKGIKKVEVAIRAKADIYDEDGNLEYYKGEILYDNYGEPKTKMVNFIDIELGEKLWDASALPKDKQFRIRYNATEIPYNPGGKNREKLPYETLADYINDDWDFPLYETDRPAGSYLVDVGAVNTMIIAMTRAGKGQTYIEPMLDMWTREKRPNNAVINDPKGELLVKNYVRMSLRGYQVVQFNLINPLKTDIYNPLGMAAEAARENDTTKVAMYIENITEVFFPTEGADDPFWPNAAGNAFKRVAHGIIDYYLDRERQIRLAAVRTGKDQALLETELDELWGKVTLYNAYQMFVQLSSKKKPSPLAALQKEHEEPGAEMIDDQEWEAREREAKLLEPLWNGEAEIDCLSLYFNATEMLPINGQRTQVMNASNSLKAMGGSEKTISSVYGISIVAMSFFTDPTISTLTSGTPSQNTDLAGLSFPRRLGVQFNMNYLNSRHWVGKQANFSAYADAQFTKNLGKLFNHTDTVNREGWARYYFEGKFPEAVAYIKLEIVDSVTGMLSKTFYFRFNRDYQKSLDGTRFIKDPISGDYIIKDGLLTELMMGKDGVAVEGHTTFKVKKLRHLTGGNPEVYNATDRAIQALKVRYTEKPRMVFLVTPPHLMKYAQLILILIKQLTDLNFDQSYMTKSNQKPLYKTRFMLDELGNLQSSGNGISGLETSLSIGLGQEQQFTLILQTLSQLISVYGEGVDKTIQGNTSNIIFLKSTDDGLLETLEKMSGKRHVAYRDSKTITKDVQKLAFGTEGKVSYTMSVKEEPVISYTDMNSIAERNSVVFRAGKLPIWNRNEMIPPMSWQLFEGAPVHAGHEYTLQTIPTLSTAMEFDVRQNQPNFETMLTRRLAQARYTASATKMYNEAFDYSDFDVSRLDPNLYAEGVMEVVDRLVNKELHSDEDAEAEFEDMDYGNMNAMVDAVPNEAFFDAAAQVEQSVEYTAKIYADHQLSRDDFIFTAPTGTGGALRPNGVREVEGLRRVLANAYHRNKGEFARDSNFVVTDSGELYKAGESERWISIESLGTDGFNEAMVDANTRVFGEEPIEDQTEYVVSDDFIKYLISLDSWVDIANGTFEKEVARAMRDDSSLL